MLLKIYLTIAICVDDVRNHWVMWVVFQEVLAGRATISDSFVHMLVLRWCSWLASCSVKLWLYVVLFVLLVLVLDLIFFLSAVACFLATYIFHVTPPWKILNGMVWYDVCLNNEFLAMSHIIIFIDLLCSYLLLAWFSERGARRRQDVD